MTQKKIITLPDPLLKTQSAALERVDDEVRKLLDDMLETMYAAPGIGLAAIQVAVPKCALVVDIAGEDEEKAPLFMINPEVVQTGDDLRLHEEGCLSIPEFFAEVERPNQITVWYVDRDGARREDAFEGLLSTVIQHEVDHLNGILFIDHISRLKRDRVIKKFVKAAKASATAL